MLQGVKRNKWNKILCGHNNPKYQCGDCGTGGCEHGRRRPSRCRICKPLNWAKYILQGLNRKAKKKGHVQANGTPEEVVRLSSTPDCYACWMPLNWSGQGPTETPHLHHNHENGEILGFVHPVCNYVEGKIQSIAKGGIEKYLRAMFPKVFQRS